MTSETLTISNVYPGKFGGAIFSGTSSAGNPIRIVASGSILFRLPVEGETWEITGNYLSHPQYGIQLHADSAHPLLPSGKMLVRFLSRSSAFQGIGDVRAGRLWKAFGESLYGILDRQEREPLIPLLGEEPTDCLLTAWLEIQAEGQVVKWLDENGFPLKLAFKVLRFWGAEGPAKISENPYRMLALAPWAQVDQAARGLGWGQGSRERQIAAVEAACYRQMAEKHTASPEGTLISEVASLLQATLTEAREALLAAQEDGAVVDLGNGLWQAFGPHVMESSIGQRIQATIDATVTIAPHLFWKEPSEEVVDSLLKDFEAEEGYALTPEQRLGVKMALAKPFSVVKGGAGVGKTSLLKAVHFTMERLDGTVHQMALAGRAAMRMTEATGRPARTIAGFLIARESSTIALGINDLVVIDESSMVDLSLAYRLFRAVPEDCRMLWVGDPSQLPPIGMGVVFSALCESPTVPKVELTRVHRQAESTGIPAVASAIREGYVPQLPTFQGKKPGVSFIPIAAADGMGAILDVLATCDGVETQVLGVTKGGPVGIQAINSTIHGIKAIGKPIWQGLALGDPVIHLKNDYQRMVFNGSLGTVCEVMPEGGGVQIVFDGQDKPILFSEEQRDDLDLAYAISCHKSQGSQFRTVIVPVYPSRILDRTLIYTAVTRAIEQVILLGDTNAFAQAVRMEPAPRRRKTGLDLWLNSNNAPSE